eukprot:TRINITY_DN6829_c0_g2_i1.p1 TRINITY_DN6829_c0_g2~~TRINITY_DN6829_c0_g2_i1.p1  ORF type:complete len:1188 (+),score=505.06 TRINITY_DN6829_c0_g2_i1:411-3566(+)
MAALAQRDLQRLRKEMAEQKEKYEKQLRQKSEELSKERERNSKEKEEFKRRVDTLREEFQDSEEDYQTQLRDKDEQMEVLRVDILIAKEETQQAEDMLSKWQSEQETGLWDVPEDAQDLREQHIKALGHLKNQGMVLEQLRLDLTAEKERCNQMMHVEQTCKNLEAQNKGLQARVDEQRHAAKELEAAGATILDLELTLDDLRRENKDLKELHTLEVEQCQFHEAEACEKSDEAQRAWAQAQEFMQDLTDISRKLVETEELLDKFRDRDADKTLEISDLRMLVQGAQDKMEAGHAREQQLHQQRGVQSQLDGFKRRWEIRERDAARHVSDSYRGWVLDFIPTDVVDTETPILDCHAGVERCLSYAQLLKQASRDVLVLHPLVTDDVDEQGYSQPSATVRLVRDHQWERHDREVICLLVEIHMSLSSFVLHSFQSACNRAADTVLLSEAPQAYVSLEGCEVAQRELQRVLSTDALTSKAVVEATSTLFSSAARLWEACEALLPEAQRVESGSLLYFLLAVLEASELLAKQLATAERYMRQHLQHVGLSQSDADLDYDSSDSDAPEPTTAAGTAALQFLKIIKTVTAKRQEMHGYVRSLYKELEDQQAELEMLLDRRKFEKLKFVLLFLLVSGLRLRTWCIVMHERAVDIRNGIMVSVGFFTPAVVEAGHVALTRASFKLADFLAREERSEEPRVLCCDPRNSLTEVFFTAGQMGAQGCIDDSDSITLLIGEAAHVARMVWVELQKEYWRPDDGEAAAKAPPRPARERRALAVRDELASVSALHATVQEQAAKLAEAAEDAEKAAADAAEVLFEQARLRRALEDTKGEVHDTMSLRQELDRAKEAHLTDVADYQKAIEILQTEKTSLSDDVKTLSAKLKKAREDRRDKYTSIRESVPQQHWHGSGQPPLPGQRGVDIDVVALQEVQRLRGSLVYSQQLLREEKGAVWQSRWAVAFKGGLWSDNEQQLPVSERTSVGERLRRVRETVTALRQHGGAAGLPCAVPEIERGWHAFVSRRAEQKAEEGYLGRLATARDEVAAIKAELCKGKVRCASP